MDGHNKKTTINILCLHSSNMLLHCVLKVESTKNKKLKICKVRKKNEKAKTT
jgi:hypothetical protein